MALAADPDRHHECEEGVEDEGAGVEVLLDLRGGGSQQARGVELPVADQQANGNDGAGGGDGKILNVEGPFCLEANCEKDPEEGQETVDPEGG